MDKKFKVIGVKTCLYCGEPVKNNQHDFCCLSHSKMGKYNSMYGKIPTNYKGGTKTKSGSRNILYNEIWVDNKRVKEHRLLMEKYLGRKLNSNEVVHHKDGNGLNNSLDNLELMSKSEHSRLHADVSCLNGGGELCGIQL